MTLSVSGDTVPQPEPPLGKVFSTTPPEAYHYSPLALSYKGNSFSLSPLPSTNIIRTKETHPVLSRRSGRVRYESLLQKKPIPAPLCPMVMYAMKVFYKENPFLHLGAPWSYTLANVSQKKPTPAPLCPVVMYLKKEKHFCWPLAPLATGASPLL